MSRHAKRQLTAPAGNHADDLSSWLPAGTRFVDRETLHFMIAKLQCVVLDCADVVELSRFYQSLLGGVVNQPDPRWALSDGWATLHTDGLVLAFQRVADHRPPRWPDPARPQQFHLDLGVKDLDRAQQDVLSLGATLLDEGDGKRSWRIFADPAGHPLCLVRD